jgi:hypothetical protein
LTGFSNFAGQSLTFSVENLSAPISVTIGSKTATLTEGAGRRSVTMTLDPATTGHLVLRLQGSGTTTFQRPRLELGESATPWKGDWLDVEEHRCRRYYQRMAVSGTTPTLAAGMAQRKGPNTIELSYAFPVPMRAAPTMLIPAMAWIGASPGTSQVACYDAASASWLLNSGSVSINAAAPATNVAAIARFQAATSFTGSPGSIGQIHFGAGAYIGFQAEL